MIQDLTLVRKAPGKYCARIQCVVCREVYDIPVKLTQFTAWRKGQCIQDAMPGVSPDARELLASGTCPLCWNKMFKRVVVLGWPKSGKSAYAAILAQQYGLPIRATDTLIDLPWSRQSEVVRDWLDEDGPWLIEGVVVVRALRKWHELYPDQPPPVDELVVMPPPPLESLTPAQIVMGKGHDTILEQITEWLAQHARGLREVKLERK